MEKSVVNYIGEVLSDLYVLDYNKLNITLDRTKPGIEGDFTMVVFPYVKYSKKSPVDTAKEIGVALKARCEDVDSYNVIQGFLNITMTHEYWLKKLNNMSLGANADADNAGKPTIMVEFSSPNTNKPLHLGHLRNNFLGDSVSRIIKAAGNNVVKVNLVNDRGIHICKSMIAWLKWGEGATPESRGVKGDKLVGDFYVLFNNKFKEEVAKLKESGLTDEEAEKQSPLMRETREMLQKWEAGDEEVRKVWNMMNSWVYAGFNETYNKIGISFDRIYYESQTYLLGKSIVTKGLERGVFTRDADSSVWIDLTDEGLDRKILLRSDGTTVYMTQDIGTAAQRFEEYNPEKLIYVVGNEQDYHFNVLRKIVQRLGENYYDKIFHLSYGMVELPEGKMKSREGTVVDADDLVADMIETARAISEENGKLGDLDEAEKNRIIEMIAIGALKYFILKVDPKKQMVFNPKESIDFNGNTGPFIQYTHARICSILRKAKALNLNVQKKISEEVRLLDKEVSIISTLSSFPKIVTDAANKLDPGTIANYVYNLCKEYNQFYHDYSILNETDANVIQLRLLLSQQVAHTIKEAMNLLGIDVPEVM
ncbi:MAG: arginine--tRNA ligase [Bacteroidales bacterium]|nr:arginine--tRNA ligase [Bacteroidales bacterium]